MARPVPFHLQPLSIWRTTTRASKPGAARPPTGEARDAPLRRHRDACASIPYSSAIRRKTSSRQDAGVLHVDEITCIDNGQGTAIPWLPAGRAPCS